MEANRIDYKIWTTFGASKVLQNLSYIEDDAVDLDFCAAKNEFEGLNLIVSSKKELLINDIFCSNLKSNEDDISRENLEIFVQDYMNIQEETTTEHPKGIYPDALIPFNIYIKTHKILYVEKNRNQGLYVRVFVPSNAKSGYYIGTLSIVINNEMNSFPISLKVYGFSIPQKPSLKTSFGIWYNLLPQEYGIEFGSDEHKKLSRNYFNALLNYRICPMDLPLYTNSVEEFIDIADELLTDERVTSFRIPFFKIDKDDLDFERLSSFLKAIENKLYKDRAFLYFDMLDEPQLAPERESKIIPYCERIALIQEELRYKINHVLTTHFSEKYKDVIDIFCPTIDSYKSPYISKLKQFDRKDNWWYTCVVPKYPFPTYHINDYLIGARLLSWMQIYYNISCNLYWCTNLYLKQVNLEFSRRDVYNDPLAWPGANGDGFLLYSGIKYGLMEPIGSLRLEAIRDGLEDAEYILILKKLMEKKGLDFEKYFDSLSKKLFNGPGLYSTNLANLKAIKEKIALDIETLNKAAVQIPHKELDIEELFLKRTPLCYFEDETFYLGNSKNCNALITNFEPTQGEKCLNVLPIDENQDVVICLDKTNYLFHTDISKFISLHFDIKIRNKVCVTVCINDNKGNKFTADLYKNKDKWESHRIDTRDIELSLVDIKNIISILFIIENCERNSAISFDNIFFLASKRFYKKDTIKINKTISKFNIGKEDEKGTFSNYEEICNELILNFKSDIQAKFSAIWDDRWLYFHFVINDKIIITRNGFPWEDDSIELYIDTQFIKSTRDGLFDKQLLFRVFDENIYENGKENNSLNQDIKFRFIKKQEGYECFIKISFEYLNVIPKKGQLLSITSHINNKDTLEGTTDNVLYFTENVWQDAVSSENWADFILWE